MTPAKHPTALRVQAILGPRFAVVAFEDSTRTSADAAAAIGCTVSQIAKSVIFRTAKDNRPVLVVASGSNRIDDKKVAAAIGEKVKSADADYVLANTGFVIGGVPPVGHAVPPITLLDPDLKQHQVIWAAGGTPHSVFRLTWDDLVSLTEGKAADVAKAALPDQAARP
ncbi:MAG: YbaK/EbsC family protein [Proteobacteria bacterium]|nr:YbaK/EbsC family protein [Pseudomonadota bacterium]